MFSVSWNLGVPIIVSSSAGDSRASSYSLVSSLLSVLNTGVTPGPWLEGLGAEIIASPLIGLPPSGPWGETPAAPAPAAPAPFSRLPPFWAFLFFRLFMQQKKRIIVAITAKPTGIPTPQPTATAVVLLFFLLVRGTAVDEALEVAELVDEAEPEVLEALEVLLAELEPELVALAELPEELSELELAVELALLSLAVELALLSLELEPEVELAEAEELTLLVVDESTP